MVEPLAVYLSLQPGQWLAGEVLRYSLLKRTRAQVQFHELEPYLPSRGRIAPSLTRWLIPCLQGFKGQALFMTANKVVLDDIERLFLFDRDKPTEKPALASPVLEPPGAEGYHTDLMRLDCERLKGWNLEYIAGDLSPEKMSALEWGLPESPFYADLGALDPCWNTTGALTDKTQIYSFSDVKNEPWRNRTHPHRELFLRELKAALESEQVAMEALLIEIQRGHVYPKILEDLAALPG